MKNLNFTFLLVATLTILSSCKNDLPVEGPIDPIIDDCVFVQNDDDLDGLVDSTELALMTECSANAFTSKNEIEENLIGEWELIGHGEGWIPIKSQPCAYITIRAEELTFKFDASSANTGTTTVHSWEIEEVNAPGGIFFRLITLPDYVEGLYMTQFSSTYMYGNAMPSDGNMYLYRKVK